MRPLLSQEPTFYSGDHRKRQQKKYGLTKMVTAREGVRGVQEYYQGNSPPRPESELTCPGISKGLPTGKGKTPNKEQTVERGPEKFVSVHRQTWTAVRTVLPKRSNGKPEKDKEDAPAVHTKDAGGLESPKNCKPPLFHQNFG